MVIANVLVTGGAGFIGSHALLALQDAGIPCVALDNLSSGFPEAVPPGVPLYREDVADGAAVRRLLRDLSVSHVLHFAAAVDVAESVGEPLRYLRTNAGATFSLVEACAEAGVRGLVLSSTAAVYGDTDGRPVGEDTEPRPHSPYGMSKLMAEYAVREAARAHGLPAVVLRYFNVAGADPRGRAGQRTARATHLLKVACEAALGVRPHVKVYGDDFPTRDGTGERDYIHVTDLAEAHVAALRHLDVGGGTTVLNCGYGRGFTVHEVLDAVERAAGIRLKRVGAPRRPGDAAAVVADSSRIRRVLRWEPRLDDLDAMVSSALAWEARMRGVAVPAGRASR